MNELVLYLLILAMFGYPIGFGTTWLALDLWDRRRRKRNLCVSCKDDIKEFSRDFCLCDCHHPYVYHHNVKEEKK